MPSSPTAGRVVSSAQAKGICDGALQRKQMRERPVPRTGRVTLAPALQRKVETNGSVRSTKGRRDPWILDGLAGRQAHRAKRSGKQLNRRSAFASSRRSPKMRSVIDERIPPSLSGQAWVMGGAPRFAAPAKARPRAVPCRAGLLLAGSKLLKRSDDSRAPEPGARTAAFHP